MQFRIDQPTVDRIVDAAEIVDVVSQYVTLRRRGVNYVGLCPFHEDKTPSFYVSPSKNICKCFACGEGGNAVHFIMKHEQLSYFEALKFLAKRYNIEVEERELTDEQKEEYNERESLFIINEYARDYFSNTLHQHIEGKSVGLSYFKERGFREDIIKKFQLGYSLEQRDAFTSMALQTGYKKDLLVKTGLTLEGDNYTIDRFRGRVMFPIHTLSGKVVGFGGRILKKAENTGKYVNSPESSIYSKSRELYGIYFAKQAMSKLDTCFLVEGYTDVISMHQAGIENVVASSGTALTKGQIKLIHRFTQNVIVIYDGDAAGIAAALRGIDLLLEEGLNIKVVLLPNGEDPDSFARKQNAQSFNAYIKENEVDFIRFKTQLLLDEAGGDPIKRAALITDIVDSISVIPDNIIRAVYIKDCSMQLDVSEGVLVNAVNKKRLQLLEKTVVKPNYTQQASPGFPPPPPPADFMIPEDMGGTVSAVVSTTPYDRYELSILYYVVRHGMEKVVDPENEQAVKDAGDMADMTVLEYVKFDLERDNLWFGNETYKQILDEAVERMQDASFLPSRYFLAHPNADVSKIAAELISDKYEQSKVHLKQFGENAKIEDTPLAEEKNLARSVPWVLTELKNAYVVKKLKSLKTELSKEKDFEKIKEILTQIRDLEEIKSVLAKVLGERVVLR